MYTDTNGVINTDLTRQCDVIRHNESFVGSIDLILRNNFTVLSSTKCLSFLIYNCKESFSVA